MIYPSNFEQKTGFDKVRKLVAEKCLSPLGEERVARAETGPESGGTLASYGVTLTLNDGLVLNAEVTRQGGKMLWIMPEHAAFGGGLTLEESAEAARTFLEQRGYGEMEANHYQVYDGMAVMYRKLLLDSGELSLLGGAASGAVPMQLEVLGADKKKGFLFNTTSTFTTFAQAGEMAEALAEDGVENLLMVYRCYTKNNEAGTKLLGQLGSAQELEELRAQLESRGGEFKLYLDPLTANEDQITQRTEAANNLSSMVIKWTNSLDVYGAMYDTTYVYRLSRAERAIDSALSRDYGADFALDQLSFRLYSDFTSGKEVTRAESLGRIEALAEKLAGGGRLTMYRPNQYFWALTDRFLGAPTVSSQLLYESDTVPFLQIVLSGCVELFSEPLNTSSCSREKLLRLIEYGMAPAFTAAACSSVELVNTAQAAYSSAGFEDWRDMMAETYDMVATALESVWGRCITEHSCLETGLVRVSYDNGVRIYVNYTDKVLTADGLSVEPGWFAVAE